MKLRLTAINLIESVFIQFFQFPDTEFQKRYTYERQKLQYQPMFTGVQPSL